MKTNQVNENIPTSVVEFLNKRVSFQKNTWSALSKEMTIDEVLNDIQSDIHKAQVQKLRSLIQNDKRDEYNSHKRTLSAVTFCGTFDFERKKSKIKNYNSIIILDVDKLDEKQLEYVKESFHNDQFVFSFWDSPSKEGVKGLVSLNYKFELNSGILDIAHKGAFNKLAFYFKEKYNIILDNSGSDITRLCFFSFDPLITTKNTIVDFDIFEKDILFNVESDVKLKNVERIFASNKVALYNPSNRNAPSDRYTIAAIIRFLEKKKLSITYTYEEWYKVAMAIANSFTHEIGEKYFISLSKLDNDKFNEIECKNFLINCYESTYGTFKFNTIVYLANSKGYLTKKQR